MELRIYFRHLQLYDLYGKAIIYNVPGSKPVNPLNVERLYGTVPQTAWIDVTNDVSGLDKLKLTWTIERGSDGEPAANGAFQQKRGASGTLQIEGDAYRFVKAWCDDHVAAPLNAIDVKIVDSTCGEYAQWSIYSTQLQHCNNDVCYYELTLKQTEDPFHCIQKTVISDNWQHMFQPQPANGKMHPRFSYCNEIRPNATLIVTWYLMGFISSIVITTILSIIILTGNIGGIFTWIFKQLKKLGINLPNWLKNILPPGTDDLKAARERLRLMYIESAGCGREHPAPLIRDYIKNVCDKCGVKVDENTCPVFFSSTLRSPKGNFIEASSGVKSGFNPHYNACLLHAPVARGIRRFSGIDEPGSFEIEENTVDFYIDANAPNIALSDFLNQLKEVYNADWRIRNVNGEPHLYFWRKDWFHQSPPLYDFRDGAADAYKIIQGVCFEWNEVSYPAYAKGIYSLDALDSCGNEATDQMGGYADFGSTDKNKLFGGELDKTTNHFGATKFRLDGASTDYLYDAMQQLLNSQLLQPTTEPQMRYVNQWVDKYANYALLLRDESCTLPKILIWDTNSGYLNAKAVSNMWPMDTTLVSGAPKPVPNTRYNKNAIWWNWRHKVNTHVLGNKISFLSPSDGVYTILGLVSRFTEKEARLVNYPMYFEPWYNDTLWDWYHWIDDPLANPQLHKNWSLKMELCCDELKKLRLVNDSTDAAVGDTVKLPSQYYQDGIIKEIEISYDPSDKDGMYIQLKGTV